MSDSEKIKYVCKNCGKIVFGSSFVPSSIEAGECEKPVTPDKSHVWTISDK